MKPNLAQWMSLNGGYTDTAGFLALQGLFTAHVTGNFVTLASALVHGTSGAIAKLVALPLFCLVVVLARLLGSWLPRVGWPVLRTMLILKCVLLALGAVFAIHYGPFPDGDAGPALLTGMTLVAAMAIQNAAHRIHLSTSPPTTLMTGTTTQVMVDLADWLHGIDPSARDATLARLRKMTASVLVRGLVLRRAAVARAVWRRAAGPRP